MEKVLIKNLTKSVLTLRILRTGKPLPVLPEKSVDVETVKLIPEAYNILNSNVNSGMIEYETISAVKDSANKATKAAADKKAAEDAAKEEADKLAAEEASKKKAEEDAAAAKAKEEQEAKAEAEAEAAKKAEEEKKAAEAEKKSSKK